MRSLLPLILLSLLAYISRTEGSAHEFGQVDKSMFITNDPHHPDEDTGDVSDGDGSEGGDKDEGTGARYGYRRKYGYKKKYSYGGYKIVKVLLT